MKLLREISQIDGDLHRQNIAILQAVSASGLISDLRARLPNVFDETDQGFIRDGDALVPRMAVVWDLSSRTILIVLQGMVNYDKVQACLTGWDNWLDQRTQTVYPYETAALTIFGLLPVAPSDQDWNEVRVIGHSYGGAVGSYVPKHMLNLGSLTEIAIYTYGSPKCQINSSGLTTRLKEANRRVFLQTDPVPLLPLSSSDLGSLWTLTGVPLARRWSRWTHGFTGFSIYPGNVMDSALLPTFQQWSGPIFSLASWATGIRAFGSDQHTLAAYATAIQPVPRVPDPQPYPSTQVSRGHTVVPDTMQLQRQMDLALVVAGEATNQNPQATVIGIANGVPIIRGERFHGSKRNGEQVIIYNGNVVTYVKTLRLRRSLVKQLNRTVAI